MRVDIVGKVSIDELLAAADRVWCEAEERYARSGVTLFEDGRVGIALSVLEGDRRDRVRAVLASITTHLDVSVVDDYGCPVGIQHADEPIIVSA